jgi:hypothetical protein
VWSCEYFFYPFAMQVADLCVFYCQRVAVAADMGSSRYGECAEFPPHMCLRFRRVALCMRPIYAVYTLEGLRPPIMRGVIRRWQICGAWRIGRKSSRMRWLPVMRGVVRKLILLPEEFSPFGVSEGGTVSTPPFLLGIFCGWNWKHATVFSWNVCFNVWKAR